MTQFSPTQFRNHFPLLHLKIDNKALIYFDNAATTQKPQCVLKAINHYYQYQNANVHRASHYLSSEATTAFEEAREKVRAFINAGSTKEVIWTKGTTESINLVSQSLGLDHLTEGDEIVLSESEHHANIVPWQIVAQKTGATIRVLPLTKFGTIDISNIETLINAKTKIVAIAHVSNVLGKINPIETVINRAKKVGALSLIDGAQAIAHLTIDVQKLDCDFYVFSAHKVFGPTGVGVLYGKEAILNAMQPYQSGGEMIKTVSFNKPTTFNTLPFKFEAGTANISSIVAFAKTIDFIKPYIQESIDYSEYEKQITRYCYQQLASIKGVTFISEGTPDIPVLSFTLNGHHNHDVASMLDSYGIAVRAGHHCAMPLMEYLTISGCIRVSLAPYNTYEEIDIMINAIHNIVSNENFIDSNNAAQENVKTSLNEITLDSIIEKFSKIKGWDNRHREIMLLGKTLTRLNKAERRDEYLIKGCESLAWLKIEKTERNTFLLSADSDAKIIRGLLVIVLSAYNGKTAEEIKQFTIEEYFGKLGLLQHLSPSRGNGLRAIVETIKRTVK